MDAGAAEDDERGDDDGCNQDGVGWGSVAGVKAREPGGDEVVPAGGHGEAGYSGEDVAGRAEDADLQKKDDEAREERGDGCCRRRPGEGSGGWERCS